MSPSSAGTSGRKRNALADDIVPESEDDEDKASTRKTKKTKRRPGEELVHSSVWFRKKVAADLWMPDKSTLTRVRKPRRARRARRARTRKRRRRRRTQTRARRARSQRPVYVREHLPERQRVLEPLLTSWFEVENFAEETLPRPWRTENMPPARASREIVDELRSLGALVEDDEGRVNSVVKLRLFPTKTQKEKLDQMFAANRAIYNKLVACSREDRVSKTVEGKKMSLTQLNKKYRPIAKLGTMGKYFRNKKSLKRHMQVQDEVRDSAFQDFMKAAKSSIAGFFAARRRDEKSTYPDMRFKSKFAPSNTIEVLARSLKKRDHNGLDHVVFHPVFFGNKDGIALHEKLPPISMSVHLQRLREGEYYLTVPRFKKFPQSKTTRVCAIDPGVRNFISVYDPDGRTFSVSDSRSVLKRKFEAIDEMKSILKLKDNECKERHPTKVRTKTKKETKSPKAAEHRLRYRLRRRIRFTSRKATRAVQDMHQKLSSWLATNYYNVLLPSFQTSEMVRKHFEEEAADATPGSSNEERVTTRQKRNIPSPTARSMLAQAHFKFKQLLKHKMERAGGRVVDCEEEYTSKTCSRCGEIQNNLGGNHVFTCAFCHAVLDRDVSAAKNIFHKNIGLLF